MCDCRICYAAQQFRQTIVKQDEWCNPPTRLIDESGGLKGVWYQTILTAQDVVAARPHKTDASSLQPEPPLGESGGWSLQTMRSIAEVYSVGMIITPEHLFVFRAGA